jgi:hypothetical protein
MVLCCDSKNNKKTGLYINSKKELDETCQMLVDDTGLSAAMQL